jgi:class 3 adenylate cyclase
VETLTFLFTDIEGSTALLRRLGEGDYGRVLADHQALIRAALAAHDGKEVDTQGDAFFAVFSSPTACVAAVIEMQRALQTRAWPGGEHVRVRMGVHTGEAATTATGALVGLDVHRAARVGAIAHGGQVLLSETVAALVRDSLPLGAALRDLGAQRLKDLGRPEHIFQLEPDRGLALGREAVDRARSLGDDVLLGRNLMICLLSSDLLEPAQYAPLLAEATTCTERSGNQLLLSHLHNNAAVHALGAGDIPAALAHLDRAAQATRATGQQNPATAANLGWAQREEGNLQEARSSFETSLRIGRRSGEQPVMACAILGLACLAADLDGWDRSALLHGVAQAFLDRSGEPWQDLEARYRQHNLAQVRAYLGDELLDRAYAKGMALNVDQALRTALGYPAVPSGS